jgi:hypothetical protein
MMPAWRQPWPGRPGGARPWRLEEHGAAWPSSLERGARGRPKGGGAALRWSPERRPRRAAWRPGGGARCGASTEGGRGNGGDHEPQQLTTSKWRLTASPEVAGITGGRRWSAARDPVDWELLRWRRLVEDKGGDATELMVATAERGEEQNNGKVHRLGLGFGRALAEMWRKGEKETCWGCPRRQRGLIGG